MSKTYLVNLTDYEIECLFRAIRNKKSDLGFDTEKTIMEVANKLLKARDKGKFSQKTPKPQADGGGKDGGDE